MLEQSITSDRDQVTQVLEHLVEQMIEATTLPILDDSEVADIVRRSEYGLAQYIYEVDEYRKEGDDLGLLSESDLHIQCKQDVQVFKHLVRQMIEAGVLPVMDDPEVVDLAIRAEDGLVQYIYEDVYCAD